MSSTINIRPVVEGGFLTAVTVVFALISFYMPIAGLVLIFIMPLPIALLGLRHGNKWSVMATVASGLLSIILMNPLHAVIMLISSGLSGIVIGHCLRAGYSLPNTLLFGSAASLLSIIAGFVASIYVLGLNPINMQVEAVRKGMEWAFAHYRPGGPEPAAVAEKIEAITRLYMIVFPAGLAVSAIIFSYINLILVKIILARLGHPIASFPPLRQWTMPGWLVIVYGLALLSTYYGQSKSLTWIYNLGLNLQVVANSLLLVQGLAATSYLAAKYVLPRFAYIVLIILLFSHELLTQLLLLGGLFDLAFDLRKLRNTRQA